MGEPLVVATWSERLADFALRSFRSAIPDEVMDRAALQLLDTLAVAAAAQGAAPVEATRQAVPASSGGASRLWFGGGHVDPLDAVLVNGTAVRFLDANDVFLVDRGPSGHPSDNIPVSVAFAEASGASGRDLLASIAVSYELVWRLRNRLLHTLPLGRHWDHSSISGIVGAVTSALLMGADLDQLTNAVRLSATRGFTVREVRGGEISMLKAAANAVIVREGSLAARLAMAGMTGPRLAFEGQRGLVKTLGGEVSADLLEELCLPPEWVLMNVSVKPRPALGTGQAAIEAAATIAARHRLRSEDIASVTVAIPDTEWTAKHCSIRERHWPDSRESADHCIEFLTALALVEGDVLPEHYDGERWRSDDVRALMSVTELVADPALTASVPHAFPSVVKVGLRDGRTLTEEVRDPPGSPSRPWGRDEIVGKFLRLDRTGRSREAIEEIADRVMALGRGGSLAALGELLDA